MLLNAGFAPFPARLPNTSVLTAIVYTENGKW